MGAVETRPLFLFDARLERPAGRSPALRVAVLATVLLWGCSTGTETPTGADSPRVLPSAGPLLLVGIDGATFDVLLPLVEAGELPHLGKLLERGSWGPLATLEPTVSPAIWTTVATGKLPAEHGILGFEGIPGQSMATLPTSGMRRVRAYWNILSEHDRSVGVVGWWVTWPAERVNGYVVSDRTAYTRMEAASNLERQGPEEVFPLDLADEVRSRVRSPDTITVDEVRRFMNLTDDEVDRLIRGADYEHGHFLPEFKYVHQSDRSTADIATHLLRSRPTDVTAVAFYGVDTVSHLAWHFMRPEAFPGIPIAVEALEKYGKLIERYYVYTDELLGELIAAAPSDATVIVFSDHGFGASGNLPWSAGHGRLTPGAPVAPDGILLLAGPQIRPGVRLSNAHVLDITPTLLHLQGLPVAADMTGRVLTEALAPELLARLPVRTLPTYETTPWLDGEGNPHADEAIDRALIEKLRSLGYIDE
jgi:predicted AlkP superfamily phosphohydrolase/phosphomutase